VGVIPVQKGTKARLCFDARKENIRTIKDTYSLPHIDFIKWTIGFE